MKALSESLIRHDDQRSLHFVVAGVAAGDPCSVPPPGWAPSGWADVVGRYDAVIVVHAA
ncbi:MAG TPA: hypothetical protein VGR26_06845 [Acidimicrobiales bacterium]|nr:hypothetical protein [Acidimicrobiales bacterium]